uniref:Uncharacterized protein n=1 Tax=Echinococcus canadensis TaxID=519352 RepID=A0A915EY73_9CEST
MSSGVDSHGHLSSIRTSGCICQNGRNSDSQPKASLRQEQSSDERFVQTLLCPEASSLIEQIRDIKRRLSEATAELSPTVYPLATRDILTAVSLGRYEAAQHFVSSTQPVSNNGNECTHSRCHCCAGVLSFLAYLISTNSSFEQPRWSELRKILRDQHPIKHTFCCPDVENALKELVSISCELTVSTVPFHEMQEMERRLQAVDAEVVHLQSQVQSLQKLLDDVHSESNWRQSAISEELNANSMKTSSIVAWLDLATSSPTSDTESELRRQTNNSSRQGNEQELDLRAKISALIADKEAELAELRRGAVKWASKHTLIRSKQAEIEELNGVLSNGLALVPDVSESDTIIGSPKLQIPSSEDLIGHIRSLCHDLAVFFQSLKPFNAQKVLPSLKSPSDTLTEALARIRPFTGIAEISGNPTNLDHASCQQLEADRADYGLDNPLTVRIRQPMKLTRSGDTEVQGDGDLQVIDEFLSPSPPASTPRHPLPKQALSSQDQKISQLSDEHRNTNAEIEYLKLAVASLKQEVKNNQEALQLLCESRLTLLERVGALTGGDECEDSFADFVSELRQIDSLDEHLKTLDKCDDLLTQRLMNWSRKCQEDGEVALKQKEVEMTHLLARLEEEEALLKSHSDETKELHAQINLLQQPFSSKPYHIQEEITESVPLLQAFEESMQPTQAVPLKRTPSADSDQFEPFKRGVGGAVQTSHEASLQSKINDQVATISQLEARLCAQNEEFRAKLAEADEKASQFNAIQCAYESDVQQLKTVLRQKTSEVSQLQQMVSSSNQEISDLTEQIKRLKSDSKVLQEELKLAQEEAVMRSLEMENLQGVLNEKTEELSDIREVVMDHEAQMRNLRFVLNNKDVDLMERDRQIEALLNKLAISEADSEAVRKDFAQLNTIFECLWKSTLLIDDSAERSGTLPVVGHEPMLALRSSSAVDQFLSLLSSKESETVVCDVQACIRAYKSLQEKAKEQKCEVDASPTIVRDDLDLPWNPCCVTAVSAISAIMGDAKVFNLLRDLAYSESCRVRLANLLSNVESQKDQLKGMLSALQAEVETNHVQLAERNRQLILLGIDPNDTTVPISVSRTSTSNGSTTVCYVDTEDNVGTEAVLPMVQVVSQASNESDSLKKRVKALEAENTEKAKIIEQMKKLHEDSKESVFSMEQCCQEMELSKTETNRQYRQIENQFLDLKIKKRNANEEQYDKDKTEKTEKKIQPSGETQDMETKDKELQEKLEEMEEEIIENRAEKSRLQQQLHKVREKLEKLEATIGKQKLEKIPYFKEENTTNRLKKLKEIPDRKSKGKEVAKDMKEDVKEVREKGKRHKENEEMTAEESKTGRGNELRNKYAKKKVEQKEFQERIEQVIATTLHDAEVAATEMEELRQRLHEVKREKLGKTEECDRLSNEVAVLMRELNEAKARESALMSVSELPVVEPSVVEAVRADPLLSSTPPGLVQKTPVIVDVCHGHEEESTTLHEGRVAELMSMVEEAGAREGELKEQVMENVVRSRQLESELAGERAKVSKLADEVAEKELEKEALLRSCEQMTEELKVKASEQRALEERIEQVVATTLHDAEVAATEMEELR